MYNNSHRKPKKKFVNNGRAPDTLKLLLPKRKLSTKTTQKSNNDESCLPKKRLRKNLGSTSLSVLIVICLLLLKFIIQIFIWKYV